MEPKFKVREDGLVIVDPIERGQCRLETDTTIAPRSVTTNNIPYPMDTAVEITIDQFAIPSNNVVYVRDSDWSLIEEVRLNERLDLPYGEYILDISTSLKLYASVEGKVDIINRNRGTTIRFGKPIPVTISARSHHTRPATELTTTAEPADVMQAVSSLSSALKTTGPERSYPTLRGHPPTVTVGEELDIPDKLNRPDTGVKIEVPPTLRHVFVVAPLAYYLAAEVVPGPVPRLITDSGWTYPLEKERFEVTVQRIMKQVFLLDCIVRTEGSTSVQLSERQALESVLDFEIEDIYSQSLAEQLEAYLEIPFESISSYTPEWRLETCLSTTAEHIEFLPFAVTDLGMITVEGHTNRNSLTGHDQQKANPDEDGSKDREPPLPATGRYDSRIPTALQSWCDGDTEITGTISLSAYDNRIDQSVQEGPLEIIVVCNDRAMSEELVTVYSTYGDRDDISLDIVVHHDLTTKEFEKVLTRDSDFLHYIGHIDADGFRCSDGKLDAADVGTVGTNVFFLNACQSHDQGLQLVEAGSIGGIVTLDEVANREAVRVGRTISHLLNQGYSLYAALDIVRMKADIGNQYHIIGDGKQTIAQSETGSWNIYSIDSKEDGFSIRIKSYSGNQEQKGRVFIPYIESANEYYIAPNRVGPYHISKPELVKFLDLNRVPVLFDGDLKWSDEMKISDLSE